MPAQVVVTADAPLAVLNPGGNNPAKRWPAEKFAALAALAVKAGYRVRVLGSPKDQEAAETIAAAKAAPPTAGASS